MATASNTITKSKSISTKPLREFFDEQKIPYWLCRHTFSTVDGITKKTLVKSTAPPKGWLGMSYRRLMACNNQHKIKNPTTMFANLKDSKWVVLDCDDPTDSQAFLDHNYNNDNYSLSVSKNLTHKYLLKDPEDPNLTNNIGYKGLKLDILYQQVFEKMDGCIHNYNESTLETFTDFKKKPVLPTNTIATNLEEKDRIFDPTILDIINSEYFGKNGVGDYTDWRNICFSCLYSWGIVDGREICLKYSYNDDYSPLDTEASIDNMIKNYDAEKSPRFWTLCRYAKLSNADLYKKWYHETYYPHLCTNFRDLAMKMLKTEFKDRIVICKNEPYLKRDNQPVFVSGKDIVNRYLYKHISNNPEMYKWLCKNPNGEVVLEVDNVKATNDVIKYITCNAPENDDLINQLIEENKHRLWFNDGYYNFTTREFVKTGNERTGLYIDRPMCPVSNPAHRADIKSKILLKLFNCREDLVDYYLYALRMALECKISIKRFYEIVGKRDCGKSILIKMLQACFGGYVVPLSITNFYVKKSDNESKDMGFLLQSPFARIWFLNENMPKKVLNGSIIKSLCSGGDSMKVRALYKEESVITPQGTLFMFANHQLAIDPLDTNEKRVSIVLHNKFVEEGTKREYSNVTYYECDHTIEQYIEIREIIDEFTLMVLTAEPCSYPQDLLEAEEEDVEDNMSSLLLADFVYSKGSKFSNHAIKKYLKESELGIKPKELRHLLLGLINGVEKHTDKNGNQNLYNVTCISDDGIDES